MKTLVSNDFRKGYILALDSCIREGFIIDLEKKLLIKAFDKKYEVALNSGNTKNTSDSQSIND